MMLAPTSRFALRKAAILGLVTLWSVVATASSTEEYSENAVKAAYLYRFAGYISWPKEKADAPFVIAVLGSRSMAQELRQLLPSHSIDSRPMLIREVTGPGDLGKPDMLYVAPGRAVSLRKILPVAGISSLLLITDEEGGLDAGSSLNFVTVDRRIRFEVSLTAAEHSKLKISAELLGIAVRVRGTGKHSQDICSPYNTFNWLDGGCAMRLARPVAWLR